MSCLHRSDASDLERLVPRAESNLGRPFCVHSSESKTSTASPKKSSYTSVRCLPGGSVVKNALQRRRRRFGPWAGRRPPGGGHGSRLLCSCLGRPMHRGGWQYSPWGHKGSDTTESQSMHTHTSTHTFHPVLELPVSFLQFL